MKNLASKWNQISLVKRIFIGIVLGIILALTIPDAAKWVSILGTLFVGALKSVAPVLVLLIVMSAISMHKNGHQTNMKSIIALYGIGTFMAGVVGVTASFIFPVNLTLAAGAKDLTPPTGIVEVLKTLLFNFVDNPVSALMNANYIGILTWAILLGIALKKASDSTKTMISNFSEIMVLVESDA